MQLPVMNMFKKRETYDLDRVQQMLMQFGGFDRRPGAAEGTFYDQLNMSAEDYPVLSTRRKRKAVNIGDPSVAVTATAGFTFNDVFVTVQGSKVVVGTHEYDLGLSTDEADCPKQIVNMGSYVIIWPDMKYINVKRPNSDSGSLDNTYRPGLADTISVTLCKSNGYSFGQYTQGDEAPASPRNGALWMDTSGDEPVMKKWNAEMETWNTVDCYIKITSTASAQSISLGTDVHIGDGFSKGDSVKITGVGNLFDNNPTITKRRQDYIVFPGIIQVAYASLPISINPTAFSVKRPVPDMDFITECDNRLWGCKYGTVDGEPVNEIYASKLGDFKNWYVYEGLSTDSYAASRGTPGVFTGAITYQGHPLFFREDYIEKVFPSATGAHQIVTVNGQGVHEGCWRSLAIVGNTLYYKNRQGVCAYTGSLPYGVSDALDTNSYGDARAGADGKAYYISMKRSDENTWHFFTYDTEKHIWSREDDVKAMMFDSHNGRIYYLDEADGKVYRYFSTAERDVRTLNWSATTNVIGLNLAENKYVSRFVFRLETDGNVKLEVRYDEETETVNGSTVEKWVDKGTKAMSGLGSFVVPVTPKRCDHLRFRISGNQPVKIYSITKYVQQGSDVYL